MAEKAFSSFKVVIISLLVYPERTKHTYIHKRSF